MVAQMAVQKDILLAAQKVSQLVDQLVSQKAD